MSGRTRQASALLLVGLDQFQDLGLKCILRGINGADRFSEWLLLEFLLNRQAEFGELFDIRPGMKFEFFKFGETNWRFISFFRSSSCGCYSSYVAVVMANSTTFLTCMLFLGIRGRTRTSIQSLLA